MSFTQPALDPVDGLRNTTAYITRPANETDARAQIQGVIDQVVDLIKQLISELESTTETSGAENIGSKTIPGVTGTTVYDQLVNLKSQVDSVVAGGLSEGIINDPAYFDAGVVDSAAIANDAVDTQHIADGAVETAHIADGAVTGAKLAAGSIDGSNIASGSISATQLSNSAVTESKIDTGAVTTNKLADSSVTQAKLGAISTVKLGNGVTLSYTSTYPSQLVLRIPGLRPVQLCPVVFGTSATPPSDNFPIGTIYVQYEA
jgi:hypothetical protein